MVANPLETIAAAPMRLQQYVIIALCCLINVTEGYDVVSLAFAAPVMTREWGTPANLLGLVFSAGSLGLAIGAFVVGPLADRFGRRLMMFGALVAITASHALSAINNSIVELMVLRFVMGLGLGVLVVSLNVLVSEFANDRRRNFLLSLLHAGFTVGMMIGGAAAALVLVPLGWRAIFVVGAVINLALLAVLAFFLWESPSYLAIRQPKNALIRLNRILAHLGHETLSVLPPPPAKAVMGVRALLGRDLRGATLSLWLVSLTFAIVGYFLLNWKPTVLVQAGLTPTQASLGGILEAAMGMGGHLSMGGLARKGTEGRLTAFYFFMLGVSLIVFGNLHAPPLTMILAGGVLNFFTVGAYTGIFLTSIALYAPAVRGAGVGMVVGWGRIGSIFGPAIGGILLGANFGRANTFAVFAAISAIPVIAMLLLVRRGASRPASATT